MANRIDCDSDSIRREKTIPIIDLQRRLREAGRIRIGTQVATAKGGTRPAKIDKFRFTSSDEQSINAVAGLYGGIPQRWDGAPVGEQYEVYSESSALDVIVPPVDLAWSQWMEAWTAGGCTKRCDGQTNVLNDSPCSCDLDSPDCKPTTRLGVILSDLDGIGIWRLQLHGWNGAQELLGTIEVLRTLQARGQMAPARLLLEQRQSKRDGKTFNFAVPVLDLQFNVAALAAAPASAPQIGSGVTPIPTEVLPVPDISDQLHAVDVTPAPSRRANAAVPLPPTGLAPRPAVPVTDDEEPKPTHAPARASTSAELSSDSTPGGASRRSVRRLFALLGGLGIRTDEERHTWATDSLGVKVESYNDLSQEQVYALSDAAAGKPAPSEQYGPDEAPF